MSSPRRLELAFVWHMHQPDYRDHGTGEFRQPWAYLHALKDYSDMAAHLERHPRLRAVVNFVPVLLDQIEDYVGQFERGEYRDPLLRLLVRDSLDGLSEAERELVLASCFPGNHVRMVAPYPRFERLQKLQRELAGEGGALRYLSGAYFADVLVWYHLVWTGETEMRRQPLLAELMSKGEGFSRDDRLRLAAMIGDILRGLLPRWRALAGRGQVELSATPYSHPLAPLLLDLASAREAQPELALPRAHFYPGGRARVAAQIAAAVDSHARRFGAPPAGMWPAEGAVSAALVQQLAAAGCRWTASSQGVLTNSGGAPADCYRPWRLAGLAQPVLFFRDERLSDLIGFEYSSWHGRDAARHFVDQLAQIRDAAAEGETPLVCVILDGENAWEHYPYNAYYFFDDLYGLIAAQDWIETTTLSGWLDRHPDAAATLPRLTAGSWVYGNFATWIGDPDKNRAWDLLCAAKQACDYVLESGRLDEASRRAVEDQLAVCESSDWFWWFGDYNPPETVARFDVLFRANLARLYRLIGVSEPAELAQPISRGGGAPEGGGAMRRAG